MNYKLRHWRKLHSAKLHDMLHFSAAVQQRNAASLDLTRSVAHDCYRTDCEMVANHQLT